jgi:hypothetical protein
MLSGGAQVLARLIRASSPIACLRVDVGRIEKSGISVALVLSAYCIDRTSMSPTCLSASSGIGGCGSDHRYWGGDERGNNGGVHGK